MSNDNICTVSKCQFCRQSNYQGQQKIIETWISYFSLLLLFFIASCIFHCFSYFSSLPAFFIASHILHCFLYFFYKCRGFVKNAMNLHNYSNSNTKFNQKFRLILQLPLNRTCFIYLLTLDACDHRVTSSQRTHPCNCSEFIIALLVNKHGSVDCIYSISYFVKIWGSIK